MDSKSSVSHSTGVVVGHELPNNSDPEKGEIPFTRIDTVRFGHDKQIDDDIHLAANDDEGAMQRSNEPPGDTVMSKRLTLQRTHSIGSLNRSRFNQSSKVIGDFRTMSIQLSQGGLADSGKASKKERKRGGEKKTLKGAHLLLLRSFARFDSDYDCL